MEDIDEGFSRLFAECEKRAVDADYSKFRDDPAFWFTVPIGAQRDGPDFDALGRAAAFNIDLCARYMKRPKSVIGYADGKTFQRWDAVDSRHIMMSTLIFGTRAWRDDIHVVEIGGGFGNWVRLNHSVVSYHTWTIVDLPFVSALQKWYLENELGALPAIGVELIDTDAYPAWVRSHVGADLVIGAHSLSEFDWDTFCSYFENVVANARVFFYATQQALPNPDLVRKKLSHIRKRFNQSALVITENGKVGNFIFEAP